ncbi:MAG: HEAT repeat domain-containing protein, partial [Elusimicrobiales bacterium]|nr:HEAT repeat domain-containing protein [Elusimicrobiales bacterium]
HINSRDANIKLCASKSANQNKDDSTIDALFFNIDKYMAQLSFNKGYYEENLKSKLSAIYSIWALGEIGNPKILRGLKMIYAKSDEVLKVNVIISIGKTKSPKAIKILKAIANSSGEAPILRATAWEMIDYANGVKQ